VRQEYQIPASGSFIVPHGVSDRRAEFVRKARPDRVRVLFVSRLERRKGVDLLLEAAVPLLREMPQLEFVLVGKDTSNTEMSESYRGAFERTYRREPAVIGRVRFTGEVSEDVLNQWYADADVFCMPSRFESFGLVFIEAMMFGLPVIATDSGGIPEVVEHGGNGLLVAPEDPVALREALRRLVVDADLRAAYGRRSRALYEEKFTRLAMARATAAVFRTIVVAHRAELVSDGSRRRAA
jgi:glycogen(starch) synthase